MNTLLIAEILIAADGLGIGSGRLWANVAAVLGLISVSIGGIALARSARFWSVVALTVGLTGVVLSGLHLAYSAGGFGTGNGRLGAIVALVVGLSGVVLGAMTLARSRRLKPN
jgi:hypothetical protein